jgi:hypothetical protein
MIALWRNDLLESLHTGHAVICAEKGDIVQAWGDPDAVIFPRSSCKMIQALPLLESGAADHLTTEQRALLCASHNGAAIMWSVFRRGCQKWIWAMTICVAANNTPPTNQRPRASSKRTRALAKCTTTALVNTRGSCC